MSLFITLPACGLLAHLCVRRANASAPTILAAALIALAFTPQPAIAVLAGALSALGLRSRKASASGAGEGALAVGRDEAGRTLSIPLPRTRGAHTLIVGATGSGKTVTAAWILARAIDDGRGAVVLDPKGDALLRSEAAAAAARTGRPFLEWTPSGPCIYNPYGHGSPGEIADKALAGERFSEPHYLRQAQRYLGQVSAALAAAGETASPRRLVELMDPRMLEVLARSLPQESDARRVFSYLDGLEPRQRAGLSGTRDRLGILAESEFGRWLDPVMTAGPVIDLAAATEEGAVVYFRLDADRLPLLAQMLACAIVGDLLTVAAVHQSAPVPTIVAIDEFSAIAPEAVARLFGRARAAGCSLLLVTQELADLRAVSAELLDQVVGNVATVIAHRQSVPDSAELLARIAGSRTAWTVTEQLAHGLPTGRSSRRAGTVPAIAPETIRRLPPGAAAVAVPAEGTHRIARIFHP